MQNFDKERRDNVSFDAHYFEQQKVSGNNFNMHETFQKIYDINLWGSDESKSGVGSSTVDTTYLSQEIPALFEKFDINTLLDAPCGDFSWLSRIDLEIEKYIGVDIVKSLIEYNSKRFKNSTKHQFIEADLSKISLPKSDLILCRDCLVHFDFDTILQTLRNFKDSNSTYLLTTTFTECKTNENITIGDWRTINLTLPPFNLPQPETVIVENCPQGKGAYQDKSLALWRLENIDF